MTCEELFIQKLRQQGLRLTPQREMVLSALHQIDGTATAEEIFALVQARSAAVDISTVYRTLDLLQEFELVACLECGDGQRRYELLGLHGPHAHLICKKCGQAIGISTREIQPWAEYLRDQYRFAVDLDHLSLPGLCAACAAG